MAATPPQRQGNDYNIPSRARDLHSEQPDDAQDPGFLSYEAFREAKHEEYLSGLDLVRQGAAEILTLQDEMVEELASINWGELPIPNPTTASLDAVCAKVPYYILKKTAWRRTDSTSHACASALLKLIAFGLLTIPNYDTDQYGGFYRKGIKRTLDERTPYEPGEGGQYVRLWDEDYSTEDSDDDYQESLTDPMEELESEFRRLEISPNDGNPNMRCASQLNGSHGEWTESDDVKGKKGQGARRKASTIPQRRNPNKQKSRARQNAKKVVAREVGIGLASQFVGPEVARMGYKAIAKGVRGVNAFGNKVLVLSEQASKYLMAYVKPFDNMVQQVSIPRPPATRSFKVTGYIRGAGQIGANGFGFVAVTPTLCNDRPCAFYTTSIYTPTVTGAPISDYSYSSGTYLNGGLLWPACAYMSNLPYNAAALTTATGGTGSVNEVAGRIVSCSVRLYYTGTTYNEGGNYYAYSDPDVNNVLGGDHSAGVAPTGYSTAGLLSKDATEIVKVRGKSEVSLVRVSVDPNMDDYPRANNPTLRKLYPYSAGEFYTNTTDNNVGAANMVIAIDGTASQPFYFEVVTHVEYIGSGVTQGLLSDTNNDAVGYDAVKNVLHHAQREVASNPNRTFAQAVQTEMRRQGIKMGRGQRSVDY